jgi:hypothetical protein
VSEPTPIAAEELTGKFESLFHSQALRAQGWLFINGELTAELQEGLPPRKSVVLAPGEYDVREIFLLAPPHNDYLFSISHKFLVERGATVQHYFAPGGAYATSEKRILFADDAPRKFDFPARSSDRNWGYLGRSEWHCRAPAAKLRVPAMILAAGFDPEGDLRRISADVTRQYQDLLRSRRYEPVSAAAARLRASPATKPCVWMDLPDEIGGPREVDADQLRLLREWLLIEFESATHQVPKQFGWQAGDVEAEQQGRRYKPLLDALNQQVDDWRRGLERTIDDMIAALERAPEAK